MKTILLGTMLLSPVPSHMPTAQLATVLREPSGDQALLPNAPVFFLPKSSALSFLAMDVVAQAARKVAAGTIVIVRANRDQEAGETAQTALLRGDAVREELIRDGCPRLGHPYRDLGRRWNRHRGSLRRRRGYSGEGGGATHGDELTANQTQSTATPAS